MEERAAGRWYFILDLDGVVYREKQVLPGAVEFFARAREEGARWVFVTNNSTRTPESFAEKLTGLGIPTQPEQVLTSSIATARYLAGKLARELGRPVRALVIGEAGLHQTLAAAGVQVITAEVAWAERHSLPAAQPGAPAIDVAVVGLDTRFDYSKLRTACYWIRQGAVFIGTNPDKTFPYAEGIGPGCGSILAAVEACTDQKPLLMGKPGRPLLDAALERLGLGLGLDHLSSGSGQDGPGHGTEPDEVEYPGARQSRVLVIGDRLDTDIAFARRHGFPACLVLTGVTTAAEVAAGEKLPVDWRPDLVVAGLGELAVRLWG